MRRRRRITLHHIAATAAVASLAACGSHGASQAVDRAAPADPRPADAAPPATDAAPPPVFTIDAVRVKSERAGGPDVWALGVHFDVTRHRPSVADRQEGEWHVKARCLVGARTMVDAAMAWAQPGTAIAVGETRELTVTLFGRFPVTALPSRCELEFRRPTSYDEDERRQGDEPVRWCGHDHTIAPGACPAGPAAPIATDGVELQLADVTATTQSWSDDNLRLGMEGRAGLNLRFTLTALAELPPLTPFLRTTCQVGSRVVGGVALLDIGDLAPGETLARSAWPFLVPIPAIPERCEVAVGFMGGDIYPERKPRDRGRRGPTHHEPRVVARACLTGFDAASAATAGPCSPPVVVAAAADTSKPPLTIVRPYFDIGRHASYPDLAFGVVVGAPITTETRFTAAYTCHAQSSATPIEGDTEQWGYALDVLEVGVSTADRLPLLQVPVDVTSCDVSFELRTAYGTPPVPLGKFHVTAAKGGASRKPRRRRHRGRRRIARIAQKDVGRALHGSCKDQPAWELRP